MTQRRRMALVVGVTAFTLVMSGCATPTVGSDHANIGRQRVLELVNEAGVALPSHDELGSEARSGQTVELGFRSVTADDLDRENCFKKFLGYSVGQAGSIRPEVRTIVLVPLRTDPASLLARLERLWTKLGYAIDTSNLDDARHPQLQASAGEYRVYATALSDAAGFAASPRLTLYAVAPCQTSGK